MTPSWYDLLDVAPDAPPEEIRAAWKASIADLDPGDRRFRMRNEAAEVLLDPQRRAAYDAELAASAPPPEPAPAATAPAATTTTISTATSTTTHPTTRQGRVGWLVPGWLLAGVAVLTVLVIGACVWVVTTTPSDASLRESGRAAQSAAETAIGPVLSYNAAHLDEDQKAAESYLTPSYRKKYDALFAVIKQNAPQTRTVVTTKVVDSGVIRSSEDRVDVLLFVNRPTTNKQHRTPVVYKDQVTARMQKVGGDWLVDCLLTGGSDECS